MAHDYKFRASLVDIHTLQQVVSLNFCQAARQPNAPPHHVGIVLLAAAQPTPAARRTLGKPGGSHGYTAIKGVFPAVFAAEARMRVTVKLERLATSYILVPCTSAPGQEAAFSIEVSSNYAFSLSALPADGSPLPAPEAPLTFEMADEEDDELGSPAPAPQMHARVPSDAISKAKGYGFGSVGLTGITTVSELLRSREGHPGLYEDEAFHRIIVEADSSLKRKDGLKVKWLRPSELVPAGDLGPLGVASSGAMLAPLDELLALIDDSGAEVGGAPSAGSWVLGALAVIAQSPEMLARCFVPGEHSRHGVLAVRIWQWDTWQAVITDDRIPTVAGRVLLGGCVDPRQLSFALLIKAYARYHGSYEALRNGRVTEMLVDFTGGVSQKVELDVGRDSTNPAETIWAELTEIEREGALLGCQQLAGGERAANAQRLGIRLQCTYVLLQLVQLGRLKLLCVRNPWAQPRWSGRWCAGSPAWFETEGGAPSPLMQLHAHGSKYCGAAVADDETGVFWLCLEDFMRVFDRVYACRIFPRSKPRAVVYGEWDASSAGGCLNYACSWRQNPQFVLYLPRESRVFVAITQPPLLGSIGERDYLSIGVCVLRGNGHRRLLTVRRDMLLGASPISDTREVSFSLTLPATTPGNPHIIIPYTFEPGELGRFKLSMWADVKFGLAPLGSEDEWFHTELTGEWNEASGGVPNPGNDLWFRNPQWELSPLERETTMTIVLDLHPAPHPDKPSHIAIGCLLLQGGNRRKSLIDPDDVLAQAGFARAAQVATRVKLPASSEPCCLLACTFEPGQKAAFRLHLYSDQPINTRAMTSEEVENSLQEPSQWSDVEPSTSIFRAKAPLTEAQSLVDAQVYSDSYAHMAEYAYQRDDARPSVTFAETGTKDNYSPQSSRRSGIEATGRIRSRRSWRGSTDSDSRSCAIS